jgi:hypothetical protein
MKAWMVRVGMGKRRGQSSELENIVILAVVVFLFWFLAVIPV